MENSRSRQRELLPFLYLCFFSLMLPSTAVAQSSRDYLELITQYVNKVDNIYDGTWTYTLTEEDKLKDETTVRRVDPRKSFMESDVLLSVNGETPTTADIKEHQRRLKKRIQRRAIITSRKEPKTEEERLRRRLEQNGNEKERFLAMLIPESIEFVKQEGPLLYLQFKALEPEREAIFESLLGTLILDTEREFIREVQVRNTASFSPFFLTEVEDAFLSLHFAMVNGKPMQHSMSWKLVGQAFIFRDLDGEREVVWSDFVKSGSETRNE